MEKEKRKAVFFDRDGVLNGVLTDREGVRSPRTLGEFKLADGAGEVLQETKRRGYVNIVITNQPEVKRGLLDAGELEKMHKLLASRLAPDDIFVCLHGDEDNCACRKPRPGMLLDAGEKWNIDLSKSFVVGDTWRDIEAGRSAGCKTILIDADYNKDVHPDARVGSLGEMLNIV